MNYWTQSKDNIFVAAHRGWSEIYPENTMIAFEKCLEYNPEAIEMDVQMTKDGELVVFHDEALGRMTGADGFISNYTYDDIKDSFQPYYECTMLDGETDLNKVYDLRKKITDFMLYNMDDVDKFRKLMESQSKIDMEYWVEKAVEETDWVLIEPER